MIFEQINPIVPIYPIVAEQGAQYPFALYRRISFTPSYTKDRHDYQDVIGIEITICSTSYKESLSLVQKIKDRMELLRGRWRDTIVYNVSVIDSNETWNDDAYVQRLVLQITVDSTPENY